jgi:hypothetical protein
MSGILPELHQIVTGAASTTGTGVTTLIAAPSEGGICVSSLQLGRTDTATTPLTVTLNDTAGTVIVVPPGGVASPGVREIVFDAPLLVANKAALTFTSSAGVTTLYASAQGFLNV